MKLSYTHFPGSIRRLYSSNTILLHQIHREFQSPDQVFLSFDGTILYGVPQRPHEPESSSFGIGRSANSSSSSFGSMSFTYIPLGRVSSIGRSTGMKSATIVFCQISDQRCLGSPLPLPAAISAPTRNQIGNLSGESYGSPPLILLLCMSYKNP